MQGMDNMDTQVVDDQAGGGAGMPEICVCVD